MNALDPPPSGPNDPYNMKAPPEAWPGPVEPPASFARLMFLNPEGLRAGWRLLLYAGVVFAFLVLLGRLSALLGIRQGLGIFGPVSTIEGELLFFFSLFTGAAVMAKLERRSLAHYGLPLKGAFGGRFWEGAAWGVASLSLLMVAIWLGHGYTFGRVVLARPELFRYAGLWAVAFLAVGFFEEFLMRGYALFTMTTGIGFWPAAFVLSALFGSMHLGNKGESGVGGLSAGLIGLFFCLTLRRTGSLWFAIGFHAAWDYGESFIYSVPDSGVVVPGHLLDSSFRGPNWLTGGAVGPEGSVFVFVLIGLLSLAFDRLNPKVRFPAASAPASRTTLDVDAARQ